MTSFSINLIAICWCHHPALFFFLTHFPETDTEAYDPSLEKWNMLIFINLIMKSEKEIRLSYKNLYRGIQKNNVVNMK